MLYFKFIRSILYSESKRGNYVLKIYFLSFGKHSVRQLLKNEEYNYRLENSEQMVFYGFATILKSIEVVH